MNTAEAESAAFDSGNSPAAVPLHALDDLNYADTVLMRIRALARRRLAWLNTQSVSRLPGDRDLALDDLDSPTAEQHWCETEPTMRSTNRAIQGCTGLLRQNVEWPSVRLAQAFGLSASDLDVIETCFALELEPNLANTYAVLQRAQSRSYVTEHFVARLMGHPRAPLLGPTSPLLRWELIESLEVGPGEPCALRLDPHIVDFLCGRNTIDPALIECHSTIQPRSCLPTWPLASTSTRIRSVLSAGATMRMTLVGPRGSGRRTFAACLAEDLGLSVFGIDTSVVSDAQWPKVYLRAERFAHLFSEPIVWHGDAIIRRQPKTPTRFPLQFVAAEPENLSKALLDDIVEEQVVMPQLSVDERTELWRGLVASVQTWPKGSVERIAERFRLQIGDIATIGRRAVLSEDEAREASRIATRDRLGELAQLVDCRFTRDDLVLPPALDQRLDEFLFEARERARFWENRRAQRLFSGRTGLVALLAGPPGTGKTMTAQVIAAELGLDLFRVDLASLVSKYIGETAKNLRRIFLRAEEMNAVLLFDEADALFSKRTEVRDSHDRYANADTNYLLQMVENFSGIAVLSSNKRENIDPAFVRRIRYMLEFARPNEQERHRIWRSVVGELAEPGVASELEVYLERLAKSLDLSGAQIKHAVLSALFDARQRNDSLKLSHLRHGSSRELLKEGRGISPKDWERIERSG
ncbi:MAG TPA: ATP-binding protein [Polyangiaceae bacterium]